MSRLDLEAGNSLGGMKSGGLVCSCVPWPKVGIGVRSGWVEYLDVVWDGQVGWKTGRKGPV